MISTVAFVSLLSVGLANPSIPNDLLEVMIPMRDGVKLHTNIYFPRKEQDTYPVVLDRSPYGYGDMEWITQLFLPFGFVAVGQDMRGTELSEGNFSMWQSDTDDSRDLGDWIVNQTWSNGQIYTFGASADGLGSIQTPGSRPEWLAGQYVAWAPSSMYDVLFPTGAYKEKTTVDWLMGLTMPNPDVVYENIDTVHQHEAHDSYWKEIEMYGDKFGDVNFPSAFWGGWYDLFIKGTINLFEGYNYHSAESVRGQSMITIDPCGHCLEMQPFFTEDVVMGRTAVAFAQLFEVYGIRPVKRSNIKRVTYYVMSSNDDAGKEAGQYWASLDEFPTPTMTDFYLHADKTSSTKAASDDETASSTYVFDPSNPQPTNGGNNLPDSIGGSIPCGALDQAEIDTRSDVINFQTEVMTEPLAMTGPLFASLYVSSDAIDTDFMVRVSDVYPTGEVLLIQDNAARMRWREAGLTPTFMTKGEVYQVDFDIWNTSYVVAPGHALRFSISSSNYPRFSVNPNNGLALADEAYPGENITATNTIYHSAEYPSKITLPIVQKRQQPPVHVLKEVIESFPHLTKDFIASSSDKIHGALKKLGEKRKFNKHKNGGGN